MTQRKRTLLRRQITEAWRTTIEERYQRLLVNSERGLQVHFCHALMTVFEKAGKTRQIFVEPTVPIKSPPLYPDLMICNGRRVIGVIEMKFLPRGPQKFKKDLETLNFLATHLGELKIATERYLGDQKSPKSFLLADDAVLCWAGVYTGERKDLQNQIDAAHHDRFLQLDAITQDGEEPKFE